MSPERPRPREDGGDGRSVGTFGSEATIPALPDSTEPPALRGSRVQCPDSRCGLIFSCDRSFRDHRIGTFEPDRRRCLTVPEMLRKGMRSKAGVWGQARRREPKPSAHSDISAMLAPHVDWGTGERERDRRSA